MRPNDDVSEAVIGAAIAVHRALGPGLLESAYEECLCHELTARDVGYDRQVAVPVTYRGAVIDAAYRLDLVVENHLVVELKAVEEVLPVHLAQLRTYLRVTTYRAGLLINFNVPILRHGLRRVESAP